MHSLKTVVVGAFLLALTPGCSTDAPQPTVLANEGTPFTPAAPMSAEHEAAIADNHVTREEYEAAFRRFATCMEGAGGDLQSSDMNDEMISYSYTTLEIHDRCYDAEYREIDAMWQLDAIDHAPGIAAYSACLEATSVAPEIDEALKPYDLFVSLSRQMDDNNLSEPDCLDAAGVEW